ncbi:MULTISPECIES: inositol monophosphatase family protein [unclassified Neorhizobium]|uniref:inositol monophosphatase family protein n=1 Tax=unclassified Neorhizobium TaxID=2629175 RepID=UPI001FF5A170|nr:MULTISPECIES: inositol monophosphatase family protein [unclassified Neorhizobium]MCJ9672225.1 hypothetical protein [Neorhizobium sp. SHOUNA12B]MCJ9748054.1 hypothetical protein [Neorhizobium sp. SHOUNA12A]
MRDDNELAAEPKTPGDLVTAADRKVQERLGTLLQAQLPGIGIIAEEEGGMIKGKGNHFALLDPIDGTIGFAAGQRHWGVLLGLYTKKGPDYGFAFEPGESSMFQGGRQYGILKNNEHFDIPPCETELVLVGTGRLGVDTERWLAILEKLAKRSIYTRNFGATISHILSVAQGQARAYITPADAAWDLAALHAIFFGKLTFEIFALDADNKPIDGPVDFTTASQEQRYAAVVARPEDIEKYLSIMKEVLDLQ